MTRADLDVVLAGWPKLTSNGFTCKPEDFQLFRDRLANADFDHLNKIEALFRHVRRTIRPTTFSYWLKHFVDHWIDEYTSNGELIAVLLHMDFQIMVAGANAYFHLNRRDLDRVRPRRSNSFTFDCVLVRAA